MTKLDESIHPRVQNGQTVHPKVNTCEPHKNPLRGTLRKITKKLQDRWHGRDISVESLKKGGNSQIDWEKAYKRPGSMQL